MDASPQSISRDGDAAVVIEWSDGRVTRWTARQLRERCPCATCREAKKKADRQPAEPRSIGLPVLSPAEAQPLTIQSMRPTGSYAYNIGFSDGHSSGLYPLQTLYDVPGDGEASAADFPRGGGSTA